MTHLPGADHDPDMSTSTRTATHSSVSALARFEREKAERAALADRLAAEFAPSLPRHVTETVFELAWEYGHATGETEVENFYVDLIQVALKSFIAGKTAVQDCLRDGTQVTGA